MTSVLQWTTVRMITATCPRPVMQTHNGRIHLYLTTTTLKSQLNLKPPTSEMGTQCVEPVPYYITLLRNDYLCQLYTGSTLDALHSVAEHQYQFIHLQLSATHLGSDPDDSDEAAS